MRIFISYARKDTDKSFAVNLCGGFIKENIAYWFDEGEISAGASLPQSIKEAIDEATHFIPIMTQDYFESEWCLKELKYALDKQKEEKREVIIPILAKPCKIEGDLKDIIYIDASMGFEGAWKAILEEVSRFSNDNFGRKYDSNYIIDYGLAWELKKECPEDLERYFLEIDAVSVDKNRNYSIITKIVIDGNEAVTNKFKEYLHNKMDFLMKDILVEMMFEQVIKNPNDYKIVLDDGFAKRQKFGIRDMKNGISFEGQIYCRRMGQDPGKDILFNYGNIFVGIRENRSRNL